MKHYHYKIIASFFTFFSPLLAFSQTLKPPMQGLVNMGNISFYNNPKSPVVNDPNIVSPFYPSFSGMVINVTWSQLQPTDANSIAANNPIDQALTSIAAYNASHPDGKLTAKLRIWGGFDAPDWAKHILNPGSEIQINAASKSGKTQSGTIGLFWTPQYIAAWRQLQTLLAAKYDSNPLIQEIAVTSCASNTDEPFVAWLDSKTIGVLHQYGYTDAAEKACLSGAIDDYNAWKTTRIDFTFNPFHDTDNGVKVDAAFTETIMQQCQANSQCILSNHALNETVSPPLQFIYTVFLNFYNSDPKNTIINFQTASPKQLANWNNVICAATTYHAQSVELWPDFQGFTTLQPSEVASLANLLAHPASCQNE